MGTLLQRYVYLESVNVILFVKRVFAGVIKLRILGQNHPELGWVLNPMINVLTKEEKGKDTEEKGV